MPRFLCNINDIEHYNDYYIARKVYDPNGIMLLNINYKVNENIKQSLKKKDVRFVWLSDQKVQENISNEGPELRSLQSKRKALQKTFVEVKDSILKSKDNKGSVVISKKSLKKIEDCIDDILIKITENPLVAASLEPLHDEAEFLARHSINVTYYGLCLLSSYSGVIDILKDKEKGLKRFQTDSIIREYSYSLSNFGMTCFLHDIGKVAILDVVKKNEKYKKENEEVWNKIKQHPTVGHDMLFGKSLDAHALLGIKYHHENFDGSGYSYGIKQYKIHPFSRILRVVDSFDAAISKGPGRNDKSFKVILGELLAMSGICYDPEIVKYFVDLMLGGKSGLVSKGVLIT